MPRKIRVLPSAEGYDLAAKYYDEKEKYLNSFEQERFLPLLGDVADKKILDVGAGTGRVSASLAKHGARVAALDVSAKMLDRIRLKVKKNIVAVVGDAENLPFADGSFDIVISAFLIVHLKNPRRFFDEAYRVLKDGGIFVVTNINQKNPPLVKTKNEQVIIESFYHRPEQAREILEELAFGIEREIFVKEKGTWINQILVAKK